MRLLRASTKLGARQNFVFLSIHTFLLPKRFSLYYDM